MYEDEHLGKIKTEIVGLNVTIKLTGEEVLSLVAMAQLAYLSNPALGALGECGKLAAEKIQGELDPTSLLAQHLKEGWVSKDYEKFEPVNYRDFYPPKGSGSESLGL